MGTSSASSRCHGNSVGANVNPTFQKIKDQGLKFHLDLRFTGFSTIWWPENALHTVLPFPDDLRCSFRFVHATSVCSLFLILKPIVPPHSPFVFVFFGFFFAKYPRRKALPARLRRLEPVSMTTAGTLRSRCWRRVGPNVHCHLVDDCAWCEGAALAQYVEPYRL